MEDILEKPIRNSAQHQPAPRPRPDAPSPLGATVELIIRECALVDALAHSVCLLCATRVLAMDSQKRVTLYCSALFRDIETEITACTAFVPDSPKSGNAE